MKLSCPCGQWHDLSPTMLLMVVDAFVHGDLQSVSGKYGITVACVEDAFTDERVAEFHRKYPGNNVKAKTGENSGEGVGSQGVDELLQRGGVQETGFGVAGGAEEPLGG